MTDRIKIVTLIRRDICCGSSDQIWLSLRKQLHRSRTFCAGLGDQNSHYLDFIFSIAWIHSVCLPQQSQRRLPVSGRKHRPELRLHHFQVVWTSVSWDMQLNRMKCHAEKRTTKWHSATDQFKHRDLIVLFSFVSRARVLCETHKRWNLNQQNVWHEHTNKWWSFRFPYVLQFASVSLVKEDIDRCFSLMGGTVTLHQTCCK